MESFIGDNWCDDINNNPECNYDGGDCCDPNAGKMYCQVCLCLDPNYTTLPSTTGPSTPSTTYTVTISTGTTTAGIARSLKFLALSAAPVLK